MRANADAAKEKDSSHKTPLHLICKNSLVTFDMVKCLVNANTEATKEKDCEWITPLHLICTNS